MLYETTFDADKETDVQGRYITDWYVSGEPPKRLMVKAEENRVFKVRLDGRRGMALP